MRSFSFSAALLMAASVASNASAIAVVDSVNLSDLVAGGSISSGGLVFDEFTYVAVGDMPAAEDILVTAITDQDGHAGIQVQGPFYDLGDGASIVLLGYDISSEGAIGGASMMGNPAVVGPSDGVAVITQTFLPEVSDAQLEVHDLSTGAFLGMDAVDFATEHDHLTVQQSILLDGVDASVATLSFIDATYKVVNNPEPGSFGIMALATVFAMMARRRLTAPTR